MKEILNYYCPDIIIFTFITGGRYIVSAIWGILFPRLALLSVTVLLVLTLIKYINKLPGRNR